MNRFRVLNGPKWFNRSQICLWQGTNGRKSKCLIDLRMLIVRFTNILNLNNVFNQNTYDVQIRIPLNWLFAFSKQPPGFHQKICPNPWAFLATWPAPTLYLTSLSLPKRAPPPWDFHSNSKNNAWDSCLTRKLAVEKHLEGKNIATMKGFI